MTLSSRAIVLSKESFGEADCYVQFLTQQWGVIHTLAKSAKKSKRRYVGGLDLFCHNEIFLKGNPKERPYLEELSVLNSFTGLRNHLEKVLLAGELVQWVRRLASHSPPMPTLYSLLGQSLSLLEQEADLSRLELLGLFFKLKLISTLGLKPQTEACVRCSTEITSSEALFEIDSGGILCHLCASKTPRKLFTKLSQLELSFLSQMDRWKFSQWNEIRLPLEPALELRRVITQFANYHTHSRLP